VPQTSETVRRCGRRNRFSTAARRALTGCQGSAREIAVEAETFATPPPAAGHPLSLLDQYVFTAVRDE
jgi:hypothetical protein